MRQSQLFGKTLREAPKDEEAANAKLLIRAGFVDKTTAGVYTYLPLGWRVLNKIENIVREEMNNIGSQEIFMPALHPKELWQKTGRWDSFDALFKLTSRYEQEYALGPTHEEVLYSLLKNFIVSHYNLPIHLYQIQTKFRDEPRAKSGLLRNREFRMKDLYSFHANNKDRDKYYEIVKSAYLKIFKRLGLKAIETKASGGTFSDISCEFQVPCSVGEDTILICDKCRLAVNKDIAKNNNCEKCGGKIKEEKTIEVGNIFPLKERFARDFNLIFKDKDGEEKLVSAGCYGFGTSRAMGAIVEINHDAKGIIWPEEVAPFKYHFIELKTKNLKLKTEAEKLYKNLLAKNIGVLYDDRDDKTAGEKFADADLIGIPWRILISEKTLASNSAEIKKRDQKESKLIKLDKLLSMF